MPVFAFEGKYPKIDPTAFIAPTASIVGDVTIEENASVWYGAVVRGDFSPVLIKAGANIQDGSVVHAPPENPTTIGRGATIAHNCVVHGATIGDEALIANGAIVLDGAKVGARTLVAAGAVVTSNTELPEGVLVMGVPAEVRRPLAGTPAERWVRTNPLGYQQLARRHKNGVEPVGN
ncbi:MAG TPA: gamma carbonic anhydrase family protein [Dehalococcoidia bacterium]|nr:gamma carbonic anhydrase family protein [Dehalococcoidia bacterium]